MSLPAALARACFERDGWRCRHCRSRENLHPHHMIYKSHGGPDVLENLLTLCAKCHRAHHDDFLGIASWENLQGSIVVTFTRRKGWTP